MTMRRAALIAALAAMASAQTVQAAPAPGPASNRAPCLDNSDVEAIVTYALPSAMGSAMSACAPHLSPQGFFAREGQGLLTRYAAAKPAAWPHAKAALLKLAQQGGTGANGKIDPTIASMAHLPDTALQPFADGMVGQLVSERLKPDQCGALEMATRLLAPLPPGNTAALVGFVLHLTAPRPGTTGAPAGKSGLPLCPTDL